MAKKIYFSRPIGGNLFQVVDHSTQETLRAFGNKWYDSDRHGWPWDVQDTDRWTEVEVLDSTKALSGGIHAYHLHVTDEAEDVGIYGADKKIWDIGKGLVIEFRAALHIAPTLDGNIYLGVQNDSYGADSQRCFTADEIAKYAAIGFYTTVGSGLGICIRTDDGTKVSGVVDTGEVVVLDAYHRFVIDFTSLASVRFFMDGNRLAPTTTFAMDTAANLAVQPIAMGAKHSGAGLGDFYLDYCRIWQTER